MTVETATIKAQALFDQLGPKAIAAAARRAAEAESAGHAEEATLWRRIEEICKELRGNRES
ncbi:hypothetical protein [Oceanicella actignis]|uniref:Uncharacterized protein n=1 Tax=Oceanicella actignis TaxID=1189325 RepID=A0A1M7SCT2_9RHOB|nr:hypothetical protein [Oceanicella actignis]TYO91408.1 hypothetical protein LY05_00260 [Oceanicella actignis]SET25839.1 hypothetical protein SAMN04488119_103275 [Oceanicella actignis]SHN56300.1 hypothetical protein SAMN05216200_102233 [Oceanicella actignis]